MLARKTLWENKSIDETKYSGWNSPPPPLNPSPVLLYFNAIWRTHTVPKHLLLQSSDRYLKMVDKSWLPSINKTKHAYKQTCRIIIIIDKVQNFSTTYLFQRFFFSTLHDTSTQKQNGDEGFWIKYVNVGTNIVSFFNRRSRLFHLRHKVFIPIPFRFWYLLISR